MTGVEQHDALPIDEVLDDIRALMRDAGAGVLVAPPGAGKTTRVPLALAADTWAVGKKILVLEPRRIAARAAADRMAALTGTRLGERVGLRARLQSNTGPRVAVEVITEGVFTRMILDDPELPGVGAVLFDEFHERSLDADLGLALALDVRANLRPDLRLLVMSATLDAVRVASLLGEAPVIESRGRAFAVETRYTGRSDKRLDDHVVDVVMQALAREAGSLLVFLPGQGEILRVADKLRERVSDPAIDIAPLFGALTPEQQDLAIAPPKPGRRKVVLATSIAETSITIRGVRVVIDSGLARVPRYEPDIGVTRLETVRVSRAAADQRRGRAGRTEPGVCYRLWEEAATQGLMPFAEPEIRNADLSGFVLDCAEWGATDPKSLAWLDAPTDGAIEAARETLRSIGALDDGGRITPAGRRLRALPLPPRLAHMVATAAGSGQQADAADVAAILVERGVGGSDSDLDLRLEAFRRDRSRRADDVRRLARGWARMVSEAKPNTADGLIASRSTAALLALAYPERIAKARGAPGQFLLANGRAAAVESSDALSRAQFLVVAEMQGRAAATRILLAARLDAGDVAAVAGARMTASDEVTYDAGAHAVRARRTERLGAIVLASEPRAIERGEDVSHILAAGIAAHDLELLPWSAGQRQMMQRVAFLKATGGEWPDLSARALALDCGRWLHAYLAGKSRLAEITADDLGRALDTQLPWALRQRLDAEAPTHFEAPTGHRFAVDYEGAGAPAVHIRVQELFGLKVHPAIAGGRLPLTLHLLSPAHRPIQITRDLPGFWAGSWAAVRADMRGQYPRHVWPDDPANAAPTARAKPRGA